VNAVERLGEKRRVRVRIVRNAARAKMTRRNFPLNIAKTNTEENQ